MALFAIGDLHLHFGSVLRVPSQLNDPLWKNHEARLSKNCAGLVREKDTLVLVGDHSWGRNMNECAPDFDYICALPGRKVLLRGNHDMFWDAKKTEALNERFAGRLFFLQNNYAPYGDVALVGTKGFTFEGPFYLDRRGRVTGWDEQEYERAQKLVAREAERLRASFEAAQRDGFHRFVLFLHYPPTNILEKSSVFTDMAEEYGVDKVIYAHCHGQTRFHDSLEGRVRGVDYRLVSGDSLNWIPQRIVL